MMSREKPNKRYTPEFKKLVIETMYEEKLSYRKTAERFEIRHKRVQDWKHIYLTEDPEGLAVDRRSRKSKKHSPEQLSKEEDLSAKDSTASCDSTEETVEMNVDVDTDVLELTEE